MNGEDIKGYLALTPLSLVSKLHTQPLCSQSEDVFRLTRDYYWDRGIPMKLKNTTFF